MNQGARITRETRQEGYQAILPQIGGIQEACYEAVRSSSTGLTAEEVDAMTGVGLNNSRSRCTEMFKAGRFVVPCKRLNKAGTRNIAVYAVKQSKDGIRKHLGPVGLGF